MNESLVKLIIIFLPQEAHFPIIESIDLCWMQDLHHMHVVATYPSAGGRRVTRGIRVPRKEYARSRHQSLFEENVRKTGKDAIYELLSERFGSCIYARGRY